MRKSVIVVALICAAVGGEAARCQEVPAWTKARRDTVVDWLQACAREKVYTVEGKGAQARVRVDDKKLRELAAARRDKITPDLIDGLMAVFYQPPSRQFGGLFVGLLQACAEEKGDALTRGKAAFLAGMWDQGHGRTDEALAHYRRGAKLFAAARLPGWEGMCWNNIGYLYQMDGLYGEAIRHFRLALEKLNAQFGQNGPARHPAMAGALGNIGTALDNQGKYAEAITYAQRALEMNQSLFPRKAFPKGHPYIARSLSNMGHALEKQGEYTEALRYYLQAHKMWSALNERDDGSVPDLIGPVFQHNVGNALRDLGRLEEAFRHHREAVRLYRVELARLGARGHPDLARCQMNLAATLMEMGRYPEALKLILSAQVMSEARFSREAYPRGHPLLATSLNNIAVLLGRMGEYEIALPLAGQAYAMTLKLYGPVEHGPGSSHQLASLTNLARLLDARGQPEAALRLAREALFVRHRTLDALVRSSSEDRALNFAASLPLSRDTFLSIAARAKAPATTVYGAIWPGRSALTRTGEYRHLALLAGVESPRARRLYDQLIASREERVALILSQPPRDPRRRDRRLRELSEEIGRLEEALLPLLPTLKRSEDLARSGPSDLRAALPAGSAFVDLLHYTHVEQDPRVPGKKGERRTPSYAAFILTRAGVARVDLGPSHLVDDAVTLWRRALTEGSPAAWGRGASARKLVWDRLSAHLQGVDTVYFAPDGALTRLPWAALPGDKAGDLLLERYTFAVVPHGAFLLDSLTSRAEEGSSRALAALLAVGGVDYDRAPGRRGRSTSDDVDQGLLARAKASLKWEALDGAAEEVLRVQDLARGLKVTALSGAGASAERVLAALPHASIAHFATHGFFADKQFRSVLQLDERLFARRVGPHGEVTERIGAGARSPAVLSGLVFAGANRPGAPGRGVLTGADITRIDLRRLELAVLSACETGLGEVAGGEGVFGLQRSFHVAGCKNVVASLWKVNDQATAALMVLFYRYLWQEKLPPVQALRKAQLAMYHNPTKHREWAKGGRGINLKTVYAGSGQRPVDVKPSDKAHPKYWAAFVLSGAGK